MAVIAPIRSKNDQHALVGFGGSPFCFTDFFPGIGLGRIDCFVKRQGLFELSNVTSRSDDPPAAALHLPELG